MGPLDPNGPRCGAPAAPPSRGAGDSYKLSTVNVYCCSVLYEL